MVPGSGARVRAATARLLAATGMAAALASGCTVPAPTGALAGEHRHASPAVAHPEVTGVRVVSREILSAPTVAFAFRLTDRSGAAVGLSDLAGRVVLLTFSYTNCPEACPLYTSSYLQLQREFKAALDEGRLALVFITTDPERDTPQRLQSYTESLGGRWLYLTGSLGELAPVWQHYDVHREVAERTREIVVYHTYRSYLLDAEGRPRVKYTGVWSWEQVAADIRELLGAAP